MHGWWLHVETIHIIFFKKNTLQSCRLLLAQPGSINLVLSHILAVFVVFHFCATSQACCVMLNDHAKKGDKSNVRAFLEQRKSTKKKLILNLTVESHELYQNN